MFVSLVNARAPGDDLQARIAEGTKLCAAADTALKGGRPDDALKLYKQVLALLPRSPRAKAGVAKAAAADSDFLCASADTQLTAGHADDALRLYEQALAALPTRRATMGIAACHDKLIAVAPKQIVVTPAASDVKLVTEVTPRQVEVDTADRPRLILQMGHNSTIGCVAFSPDGKTLATAAGGSSDATVRLWDLATGMLIRVLETNCLPITAMAYRPDGLYLRAVNQLGDVYRWNTSTGRHSNSVNLATKWRAFCGAFSADTSMLATGNWFDNNLYVWDPAKGALLKTLSGHQGPVASCAFTPDGTTLASGSRDKNIVLWDIASARPLRTLSGHKDWVTALAFSPNGKVLASGSRDGDVRIWDSSTGNLMAQLSDKQFRGINSLEFSPDGKRVACGAVALTIVDVSSDMSLCTIAGNNAVHALAFNPVGSLLASGCASGTAVINNYATRTAVQSIGDRSSFASASACSPDGRTIASGSSKAPIRVWDTYTGKVISTMEDPATITRALVFAPGAHMLAGGCQDNAVRIWDVATGKLCATFTGHKNPISSIAFSPDGRRMITGSNDKTAKVWDVARTQELYSIGPLAGGVRSVAYSPDGKIVATATGNSVRLWDAASGTPIRKLVDTLEWDHDLGDFAMAFSPDSQTLFASTSWNVNTGEMTTGMPHGPFTSAFGFSPDRSIGILGGMDGCTVFYNLETGKKIGENRSHTARCSEIQFSPDGSIMESVGNDNSVAYTRVADKKPLCTAYMFPDGGWAVAAPDGRFDTNAPEECSSMLHWVMPDNTPLPIDLFMRQFYEPRLLPRLLNNDPSLQKPVPDIASLYCQRPTITIDPNPVVDPSDTQQVIVKITVARPNGTPPKGFSEITRRSRVPAPKDNAAYDLRLFRDGQLVGYLADAPGGSTVTAAPASGKTTYSFPVRLPRDGRKSVALTAYAFNCDLIKSDTARVVVTLPAATPVPGRAYLIAVGVNRNEDPDLDLQFCVNDATRFLSEVSSRLTATNQRLGGTKQYADVVTVPLLSSNTEHSATKANFKTVLDLLAGHPVTAEARAAVPNGDKLAKASPEDMVLIMFSSHGAADDDGNFYLIPRNMGPGPHHVLDDAFINAAISSGDLSDWLRNVDAGQIAMVIDACHSAASVEGAAFKPGPMDSRGLGQLAYDKGMRILAASQADDVAIESSTVGDGLLTYALVHDGLRASQADNDPKDGRITLAKWLKYGVARVPKLHAEVLAGNIDTFGKDANVRAIVLTRAGKPAPKPEDPAVTVQQPSLFDFNKLQADPLIDAISGTPGG